MQCTNCNTEVVDSASFCGNCGAKLDIPCAGCKGISPRGSSFCITCGLSLNVKGSVGETSALDSLRPPSDRNWTPSACPRCSTINELSSMFCYHCGLPLDESSVATSSLSYSRIQAQAGTPAGFWVRFVAWLIDLVILLVLDGIIGFIFGPQSVSDTFFEDDFGVAGMIGFLVNAVYYTVGVAVWSTTIGKRALGLYVLRPDGSKVGPGRALARWVGPVLSFITFGIGFIMIGVREDKRGLHDLICDTVVVKR